MLLEVVLLVILLFGLIYRIITKNFDRWEKAGIPGDKPRFPWGTIKQHLNSTAKEEYIKYKMEQNQKVHGWFFLGKPAISINDVDLLRNILVKDFNYFVDRKEVHHTRILTTGGGKLDKLWGKNVGVATGDNWKDIRSTFSPVFTSSKMKGMMKFIYETTKGLTSEVTKMSKLREEFELKETFGKFSLDALASCAFAVDAQCFTNTKSTFVKHASKMTINTPKDNLVLLAKLIPGVPWLLEKLNINLVKVESAKFLSGVVLHTLKARKESGERRNDLIDLMLDCMKDEETVEDTEDDLSEHEKNMKLKHKRSREKLTTDDIVGTAIAFLSAGYDTTGSVLGYLAFAMSKNPDIQEKLQQEIDEAFEDNHGDMPEYSTIQSLPYVDMCIHETLRFFPLIGLGSRSCTEDYKVPGLDITLRKDDFVTYSIAGIHSDPEHYSHPEIFYPEHFSKEEKANRHPYAFQGFGHGPRACMGMRFALLEAKIAILSTWRKFTFLPGTKTPEPLELDTENVLGSVKGGLWARVKERNQN